MAWNPSPEVAVARDAARKLNAEQVIIVYLQLRAGKIGMASYGQNKALCDEAGKLGDHLFRTAKDYFED